MKKNVLAVALVAGLGLAGAAAAYNYGTLKPGGAGYTDASESTASADLAAAEPVALEEINVTDNYSYTMHEDIIFDINPPDNAVNYTQGFTVRVTLKDGAQFDTRTNPVSGTAAGPNTIWLDPSLQATWDVNFDAFYDGGKTLSIRITPKQGVTNPQNPSSGLMVHYSQANLISLNEFYTAGVGAKVDGDFWIINPSNDAPFVESQLTKPILKLVSGVDACASSEGAETDKYIDVADSFYESQRPKTRFSWDGKLGSAIDADGGDFQAETDYDSQTIDLGTITIEAAANGSTFAWRATDKFHTVLTGDSGGWLAFENGPGPYNDDVYLVDGSCASGDVIAQGQISGSTVFFDYTAGDVGLVDQDDAALTVCAFVDTDTVINDQRIKVATTFTRAPHAPKTFAGETCELLPLRYNGSTMEIFTINPGSNTSQRSFIRLTNRSETDGYVSLEGIRDNGVRGDSQVRIWVGAGQSVQVNASELESGTFDGLTAFGAWGAAGEGIKWRAVVTAEFPGLVATSLMNSANARVVTNVTDSDTRGEQISRDWAEGSWGSEPSERPSDFVQEFEPDFRGDGNENGEPSGPNGNDGPSGGTTGAEGNPGLD